MRRIKDFLWRHSAGLAFTAMVVFVAFLGFVGYTYVVITRKFESSTRWDLPSRVYSDATPIVPGMRFARALLEPKLNHVGYHEVKARVENPGEYRYAGDDLEIYLNNFEYPDMEFHAMPVLVEMDGTNVRTIKRLSDNITLRGVRIEPELITSIYDNEMEDRVPVSLDAVPKVLVDAMLIVVMIRDGHDDRLCSERPLEYVERHAAAHVGNPDRRPARALDDPNQLLRDR